MPQETKSDLDRESVQGWIPALATESDVREALEKAFDYRGDVTIVLRDGARIEGYIFDRRSGATLKDCAVRIIPKDRDEKLSIRYCDIAALEFSGRDTAAGKSFETWVKKYNEKKRAGETNIRIEPERLE